jgi:hypothetical protein
MTALTNIMRAAARPADAITADALLADLVSTTAEHQPPRRWDAAEADALRALLLAAEKLTRKRLGENAGDLIKALIDGNNAANKAALGMDQDSAIEDATALLCGAYEGLADECAAAGSAGR